MSTANLFRKCLGFNDSKAFTLLRTDPRSGATDLSDCLNLTVTAEGAVEKVAPFVSALAHSAPLTKISAGHRFIYQDGTDVKEWNGAQVSTIGPVMAGAVAHTPLDVRVATASKVYKSAVSGSALLEAVRGPLTNLPDRATKPYYAQPVFKQAFEYNGLLYGVNAADPRFLQFSEYGLYDVFAIGDRFIGHVNPILQAGAIPGALICTHADGVTVYAGTSKADFVKRFYPCRLIDGTLFSGFVGKTFAQGNQSVTYGPCHIFLCADGVHIVTGNGEFVNLTAERTSFLDLLNSSYSCATLHDGKYLAFGNAVCIEYDFEKNTVLKRSPFGVVSAAIWKNVNYYAIGSAVTTLGSTGDTSADFAASLTLPLSDLSAPGKKSIDCFYFTGTITGDVTITATDQNGKTWAVEVSELGTVSEYRIKTPKGELGNHISFKVDCNSGAFKMEELRAVFAASKRTR